MQKMGMSAPWYTYVREMTKLFENDKEIKVLYDKDDLVVTLFVTNYEKAQALKELLPKSKEFGGVTLKIEIEYKKSAVTLEKLFETAFKDNPAFKYAKSFQASTNAITYVVFDKQVVQYWNDDMSDPHGVTSTLYQNIAANVFNDVRVTYSTDTELNKRRNVEKEYFKTHATPEEVEIWEQYNGEGSFSDGSAVKEEQLPRDSKRFTSVDEKDFPF